MSYRKIEASDLEEGEVVIYEKPQLTEEKDQEREENDQEKEEKGQEKEENDQEKEEKDQEKEVKCQEKEENDQDKEENDHKKEEKGQQQEEIPDIPEDDARYHIDTIPISHFEWYNGFKKLCGRFRDHGETIRVVGGAVRDMLLKRAPKDIDLCTTASPEKMQEMLDLTDKEEPKKFKRFDFRDAGLKHGTVTVFSMEKEFELTSLRVDVVAEDGTKTVVFGKSYKEDANRRDLTINSMSVDEHGRLFDYFGGQGDLKARQLRFVVNIRTRLAEDPLRILRYFRFICCNRDLYYKTNSSCPEEYVQAFKEMSPRLAKVHGERIWKELSKILSSERCEDSLQEMNKAGVLTALQFPEKLAMESIPDIISSAPHVKSDLSPQIKGGVILGMLFRNHQDVDKIREMGVTWQISNKAKEASKLAAGLESNPDLKTLRRKMYEAHPDSFLTARDTLLHILDCDRNCGLSKQELDRVRVFERPVFVLSKDHFGRVPRFQTKHKIAEDLIREQWVQSDFSMGEDEMINMLKEIAKE